MPLVLIQDCAQLGFAATTSLNCKPFIMYLSRSEFSDKWAQGWVSCSAVPSRPGLPPVLDSNLSSCFLILRTVATRSQNGCLGLRQHIPFQGRKEETGHEINPSSCVSPVGNKSFMKLPSDFLLSVMCLNYFTRLPLFPGETGKMYSQGDGITMLFKFPLKMKS